MPVFFSHFSSHQKAPTGETFNHQVVYWLLVRTVLSLCKYLHNELSDGIAVVLKMETLNEPTSRLHMSKLIWLPLLPNVVLSAVEMG